MGGTWLALARPNWHTRASNTLSATSVLQPLSCLTCWALTSVAGMPAASSASNGSSQIDAGAFHHRGVDLAVEHPCHHLVDAARQRLEGPRLELRLTAADGADPDRHRDLHLVNIQPRGTGMDDVKVIGLHGSASRFRTTAEADKAVGGDTHPSRVRCELLRVHGTGAGNNPGLGTDRPGPDCNREEGLTS